MKSARVVLLAAVLPIVMAVCPAQQIAKAPAGAVAQATTQDAIPVLVTFDPDTPPANAQEGIIRMVRHRLVMLPDYSTFDWLAFRVKGNTVELLGDIYSNGLKDKAVNAVEQIDGVDHVIDHMKLLPSSDSDDRIRHEESSAIYGEGSLSQYLWSARPSIHIIVNDGRVWLEGAANNRSDRETAIMRAKTVAGVLQVTDHLAIASN